VIDRAKEVILMVEETTSTPEFRARKRLKNYTGLMWHLAVFVIVNGFLWFLDLAGGDGINWAYWVTIPWGIGLGLHVASFIIGDDDESNPRYQRYLEEERQRHPII
jgi:hypothetical protein